MRSEGGSGCEDTRVCAKEWECLGEWRSGGARAGSGRGGARAERAPTGPPTGFCLRGAPRRRAFRIQRPLPKRATRRGRATGAPSARRGIQVSPGGARGEGGGQVAPSSGRGEKAGGRCHSVGSGAGKGAGTGAPSAGLGERGQDRIPSFWEKGEGLRRVSPPRREEGRSRQAPLTRGEERRVGTGAPSVGCWERGRDSPDLGPRRLSGLGGWRPPFLAGQWCE